MNRAQQQLVTAWAGVQKRAAIFEYPVRDMQDRGWILTTNDTTELESELCRFFHSPTIEAIPLAAAEYLGQGGRLPAAAGKPNNLFS